MLDLKLPERIARVRKVWRILQINWVLSGPSAEYLTPEEHYTLIDERNRLQKELEQ